MWKTPVIILSVVIISLLFIVQDKDKTIQSLSSELDEMKQTNKQFIVWIKDGKDLKIEVGEITRVYKAVK